MLRDIEINGRKINWAILVRNQLGNLGFFEVWLNQGVGNVNQFLTVLRQRLKDQYMQDSDFCIQPYLNLITIRKFRTAMTKLRVSSHRLEVEIGRWSRPVSTPFDERKCRICDKLEDEFHFLFECSLYIDLRKQYISRYFIVRPSMYNLIELFKNDSKKTVRNLSIFIYKVLICN